MKIFLRSVTIGLSLSLASMFVGVLPVSAHVLKKDNGVAGVLHIVPDDNPIAGEPTKIGISFSNTQSFDLGSCNCNVMVQDAGRILQTKQLVPAQEGATLESAATLTFPSMKVYDIVVVGSAKDGSFKDFKLVYSTRIASNTSGVQTSHGDSSQIIVAAIGSLLILAMVAANNVWQGDRYAKAKAINKGVK